MKVGVVRFPGSNCDYDSYATVKDLLQEEVEFLWHKSEELHNSDLVILPGGFSYGDYLRSGAIAAQSPIMKQVVKFARSGGLVLGICNGFQILTESGLLPGALVRNAHLRFSCEWVRVRVENLHTPFTSSLHEGEILRMPIAHAEGNYYHFAGDISALEDSGQVVFRYVDVDGKPTEAGNPNGSLNNIAGVRNAEGNVVGLMPHPERAVETVLGSTDGFRIFQSVRAALATTPSMAGNQ